jgi:hypothetical protein
MMLKLRMRMPIMAAPRVWADYLQTPPRRVGSERRLRNCHFPKKQFGADVAVDVAIVPDPVGTPVPDSLF